MMKRDLMDQDATNYKNETSLGCYEILMVYTYARMRSQFSMVVQVDRHASSLLEEGAYRSWQRAIGTI